MAMVLSTDGPSGQSTRSQEFWNQVNGGGSGSFQNVNSPQLDALTGFAQTAAQLASQMQNWAKQAYAKTSQVTDQTVNNMLGVGQQALGLSNLITDQYENVALPQYRSLATEANSYASPEHMAADMGMAGATAAQAGQQQLDAAQRDLQSYGIDPSSGRYAALDKAAAVQNAANIAGAMNTQRQKDIETGQNLRLSAVQAGMQMPGQITNAQNTATQADSAAANASLANANTGRNLMGLPNDYLKTAMELKLPPVYTPPNTSLSSGRATSDADRGGGTPQIVGSRGGDTSDSGSGGDGWSDPNNYTQPNPYGGGTYNTAPSAAISNYNTGAGGGDWGLSDYGDYVDDGSGDGSFAFAAGGAIPDGYTSGGAIPDSASPSGGRQTDDVQARLNAGEFVIPRDVALWKGQEFFQNLIDKSRQMREGASAKPQVKPALPGPTSFQSQAIPA